MMDKVSNINECFGIENTSGRSNVCNLAKILEKYGAYQDLQVGVALGGFWDGQYPGDKDQ